MSFNLKALIVRKSLNGENSSMPYHLYLVYNNQLSGGQWFNYHDISHVLMATFMFLMYRSVRELAFIKR